MTSKVSITPTQAHPKVNVSQYDEGREITFLLEENQQPYNIPSSASVKLQGTKPSGFGFDIACTYSGNTVTLITTTDMTAEAGNIPAELVISKSGLRIGTANLLLAVEASPHPTGTTDGNADEVIPELTILVERVEEASSKILDMTVVADTLPAGSDATYSYDEATNTATFGIPRGRDGVDGEVTEAQLEEVLEDYAKVDGSYGSMTVGNADQLVSNIYEEESEPYLFRTSGGSLDIGDREIDEIVGGTVAWNQLIDFADNTFTANANENQTKWLASNNFLSFVAGHKYLFMWTQVQTMASNTRNGAEYTDGTIHYQPNLANARLEKGRYSWIFAVENSTTTGNIAIWCHTPNIDVTYKDFVLFDLTQMFGSTIADYIYTLEQGSAGSGVNFFRKLFGKNYYPFDSGTLMSVNAVSHDMVGFNALNLENLKQVGTNNVKTDNRIPVISGQTYEFCLTNPMSFSGIYINEYNANGEKTKENAKYGSGAVVATLREDTVDVLLDVYVSGSVGVTLESVINAKPCFHLVWDGERNGEYEAYKKISYPLDDSLTLRGIPKLDASNNLYYDGDAYESDGTVIRKHGVVDLGTLTWTKENGHFYSNPMSGMAIFTTIQTPNFICSKYTIAPYVTVVADSTDKVIGASNTPRLYVYDSAYTDAATFKTAMSGVYLVYELATPTTETAEPYQNPQTVDNWGTEEYVTNTIVPVGHNTKYLPDLKAKLETLPNPPTSDGEYIVKQTSGENAYIALASSSTIQNIIARLEALENA